MSNKSIQATFTSAESPREFVRALKHALTTKSRTPEKGHATPKNHTPTGKGPEGWTQMPSFKTSESSSAKNKRRAKNRIAKASRKKNRSR